MSITIETKEDEYEFSNGEWAAITAMAAVFGEIEKPWNCCHDQAEHYTKEQLKRMASRAKQIGRAASVLDMMSTDGGIVSAR